MNALARQHDLPALGQSAIFTATLEAGVVALERKYGIGAAAKRTGAVSTPGTVIDRVRAEDGSTVDIRTPARESEHAKRRRLRTERAAAGCTCAFRGGYHADGCPLGATPAAAGPIETALLAGDAANDEGAT